MLMVAPDDRPRTSGIGFPLDEPSSVMPARIYGAYHLGKFDEAIELFEELNDRGHVVKQSLEIAYLSSAARGDSQLPVSVRDALNRSESNVVQIRETNPIECFWFSISSQSELTEQHIQELESLLRAASEDLWILSTAHPASVLRIADWVLTHASRSDLALKLVNCCLGWRYVYRRIDDLIALARLLNRLKAPKLFWTRLANHYFDFSYLDSTAQFLAMQTFSDEGKNASLHPAGILQSGKEIDQKEGEFHQFCADHGLPERDEIGDLLHEAFKLRNDEYVPGNRFTSTMDYHPSEPMQWLSRECFEMRHPWFRLIEQAEQDFLLNGDSVFVNCLTDDFSAACAQWWRCVESVLRRKLVTPLGSFVDANPSWLDADRRFANGLPKEEEMNWESLFVRVLSDELRRNKMSLGQMLMLAEKCMSDCRKGTRSKSTIRRHCVEHVSRNLSAFRWIKGEMDEVADMRSMISPNVLSSSVIQKFRNEASHDKPMTYSDAVVGRLVAIRILDFMHYPRYCVSRKLEELKREQAEQQGKTNQ